MTAERIRGLLNPTSIAVVGASETSVWAKELVQNILRWGFPGSIYMVNPKKNTVFGQTCYPNVSAIPSAVDHALIVVRAASVADVLRDCGQAGVRSATVIAAGFGESGAIGAALAKDVAATCAKHGIEMIGPNCYGFLNYPSRTIVSRNWIEEEPRDDGRISMIFQSGQLTLSACGSAFQRGIDLRYMVSSGNELVTDANDYFDYFIEDSGTTVLGGAIERIPEPRRFERLAHKALHAGKPIVLLKLGTSAVGSRIATSHTGAVAGVADVVNTFLRELGVVVVSSIDELMETAGLLDRRGWPRSGRAAFAGGSGGAGEYFADMAEGTCIDLVSLSEDTLGQIACVTGLAVSGLHNPLDVTASGYGALPAVASILAECGEVDLVIAQGEEPLSLELQGDDMVALIQSHMKCFADLNDKGTYAVFLSSADRAPSDFGKNVRRKLGPTYLRGKVGVIALHNAIEYSRTKAKALARTKRLLEQRSTASGSVRPLLVTSLASTSLSELDAKHVLARYGVPVTRDLRAANVIAAQAAAREIGYPVVLKVDSPHISHKSEIGGVVVGIRNDAELLEAHQGILARARAAYPSHDSSSVLVCEQIENGVELILGAVVDPSIGPVLMIGAGGIFVEIFRDVALALPPVDADEAEQMLRSLKIWPILTGARGRAKADLVSLVDTIVRSSQMIASLDSQIVELDINPVFATPTRAVAGDALIVLKESQ